MLFVCVLCFFFFFKQKTAYEMRISDWSSDVCSSDLAGHRRAPARIRREKIAACPYGRHRTSPLLHPASHDRTLLGGRVGERAGAVANDRQRSEERRVGKEGVSTCRTTWAP